MSFVSLATPDSAAATAGEGQSADAAATLETAALERSPRADPDDGRPGWIAFAVGVAYVLVLGRRRVTQNEPPA